MRPEQKHEDEEAEVHDDLPPGMANVDPRTPVTHLSDPLGRKLGDQLDPPAQELTTEAFRDVVQRYLQAMLDRGATHTTTADLYRMGPPLTGRSSEWVRQELYRLEEEAGPGEIATRRDREHPRPGVFEIIAPAAPAGALSDAA